MINEDLVGYNAILQAQVSKFNFRIIQFSSRKDTSFSLFPFSLDFFFLLDKRISRANWYVSTRKRYNRQYVEHFICIRAEEMARTLMFLADASRKPFLYLPSFSSGDWSECVLRICQPPGPPFFEIPADSHSHPLTHVSSPFSADKKSRRWINSANP